MRKGSHKSARVVTAVLDIHSEAAATVTPRRAQTVFVKPLPKTVTCCLPVLVYWLAKLGRIYGIGAAATKLAWRHTSKHAAGKVRQRCDVLFGLDLF